jgi:hypothetical protein
MHSKYVGLQFLGLRFHEFISLPQPMVPTACLSGFQVHFVAECTFLTFDAVKRGIRVSNKTRLTPTFPREGWFRIAESPLQPGAGADATKLPVRYDTIFREK